MELGRDGGFVMDEVEIDLVVKALTLAKDQPMCDMHDNIIDELTAQFEEAFENIITIGLDN